MAELKVGEEVALSGYVTKLRYCLGKSCAELDNILGFTPGTLDHGYWLCRLVEPVQPGCFALRGMTQFSGGKPAGARQTVHASMRDSLRSRATDRAVWKRVLGRAADQLNEQGIERTCRVVPMGPRKGYPAGRGVPQWELLFERKFLVELEVFPPNKVYRRPDDTIYAAQTLQ